MNNIVQVVVHGNASTDLKKLFDGLFPTWTTMLATVLALIILLSVLTFLVYKPVKKAFQSRKNYIQNNIDESERMNLEASSDREQANEELMQAQIEANEIVSNAKVKAEAVKALEVAAAKERVRTLVSDARKDIAHQQEKFEQDSKEAIINVALEAAEKVVEKEVDNKTNRKIISDFVKAK